MQEQNLSVSNLNQEKQEIFDKINHHIDINDDKIFLVQGNAGVGKSYLMTQLMHHWKNNGIKFGFIAPTNKALDAVRSKFDGELLEYFAKNENQKHLQTISSFFNESPDLNSDGEVLFTSQSDQMDLHRKLSEYDILIIDEASMVKSDHINFLLNAKNTINSNKQKITTKNQKNLQLMFVGDSKQLNPVNDKLQFSGFEILQKQKTNPQLINFEIKEIVRNKNPIYNKLLELLRKEINNPSYDSINKVKNAFVKLNEFYSNNDLLKPMYFINNIQSLLKIYNASSLQYAPTQNYDNSEDVIISYTNYGVDSINKNINKHLLKRDEFEMIKTNDYVRLNNPLGFKVQKGWYQSLPVDSLIKITSKEFGSVFLKNHLKNKTIKLNGSLVHFSIDTKNNKNQIINLRNDEKKPIFIFNLKGQIIDPNNPKIPNNENFTYLYNFKKYEAFMAEYRNDYANFEKEVKIYKQNFIADAKNVLGIDIVDHLLSLMDSNNPIYKTTEIKRQIDEEIKKQIENINNNPNSKIKYFNEREFELRFIEDLKNKTINQYLQSIKNEENEQYLTNFGLSLRYMNSRSTDLFLAKMQLFDEQNKVNEVSLPYAMTIHKSQGSTYMNTYIVFDEDIYVQKGKEKRYVVQDANDYEKHQVPLNEIANKLRLWYVALSRNQNKIVIYNNEHRVNNKVVNKTQIKGLKYDDPDIVIKCINQTSIRNKNQELIKEKEEI